MNKAYSTTYFEGPDLKKTVKFQSAGLLYSLPFFFSSLLISLSYNWKRNIISTKEQETNVFHLRSRFILINSLCLNSLSYNLLKLKETNSK